MPLALFHFGPSKGSQATRRAATLFCFRLNVAHSPPPSYFPTGFPLAASVNTSVLTDPTDKLADLSNKQLAGASESGLFTSSVGHP